MYSKRKTKKFVQQSLSFLLGAGLVVGAAVGAPQAAVAAGDTTAILAIKKTASAAEIRPGETVTYTVELSCSTVTALGCVGASFADVVPDEFEIVSAAVANASPNAATIDGQTVSVNFNEDFGDGTVGLPENADALVTISVKLREDLPHELTGVEIPNTATVTAENAEPQESTAVVKPIIDPQLSTEATKSFSPKSGQAQPGNKTTLTLSGANKSNGGVESLTITDPLDPDAGGNPFTHLAIISVAEIVWPEGATTATLEYWDGASWVAGGVVTKPGAANAPPGDPKGVRVTFTDSSGANLPQGATGGLKLALEQRANVSDLTETTTVANTIESSVSLGEQSVQDTDEADYTIVTEPIEVGATKEFSPDVLLPGQTTSVKISGSNSGLAPLTTLSIREPAIGDFDDRMNFVDFTSAVQFPQGAENGTLKLRYLDKNGVEQSYSASLNDGQPYPALPSDFGTLLSFEATYSSATASIIDGATSNIEFNVTVDEDLEKGQTIDNEILVAGTADGNTAEAKADDTITIDVKRLELETQKKISPGTIWGYEGEVATLQLPTTLKPESTTNAHSIVVNDPELAADGTPASSDWWDHFRPTAITKTDIPAGATLQIRYFSKSTNAWVELAAPAAGPQLFSLAIPAALQDDIAGLQFEFVNENPGFAPGATVQPNITTELKQSLAPKPAGSDISVKNCSAASATAPGATAGAATVDPCPEIEILAPTPGEYDLLTKRWISPEDQLVSARSGDHATSRLSWSTGGLSGVRDMTLTDTRAGQGANDGPGDAVEKTTFQAFDLYAIGPVTAEMDPLLKYDNIVAVELWNGTAWVPATNAAVPYTGTLPKIDLTVAERASTTGVRVRYEENAAARSAASVPVDAPTVGSGVARSNGNDRKLDLEWELRDTMRVGGAPVLGSEMYNSLIAGDVNNIATAVATTDDSTFREDSSDLISILDRPLNVTLAKGWTGGPLGVPVQGTPQADYPSGRVTLTATNTSVAKVDRLQIVDAKPGGDSPFDVFNVKRIVSVSNNVPGADPAKTLVVLTRADGTVITDPGTPGIQGLTPSAAQNLAPAALQNVVSVAVLYEGRIHANAKGTVVMDLQLRATHRSAPAKPVTTVNSPVHNEAVGIVEDAGGILGIHHVEATDEAQIALESLNIGVVTTKTFSPATQYTTVLPGEAGYDEEDWDTITTTLSARPSGSARPAEMVVTDDTNTFWNAYRFVGFDAAFKLAAPIERVQVDALVGGTFVEGAASTLSLQGATWTTGTPGASPALPAGVTADQVQGLRFTFTKADGSQWENPANPKQEIPLEVKRRAYLESAPLGSANPVPVPPTGAAGAPGEPGGVRAKGGRFTNTVHALVTSAVNSPASKPLTAEHSTTSQVFYESAGTEVSAVKSPVGAQLPGQVIPFTLTVKNTAPKGSGEAFAILDPVITDVIETDADGNPLLIFDPESAAARYAYALKAGDAPVDTETAMPTQPAKVTVTETKSAAGEATRIEFRFPKDTVLMPGDEYTITINMMFRPGVKAGQHVTNTFDIAGAEPFKFCNGEPYTGPNEGFFECDDDTEVYPTEAGALRGQKFVKADDTQLGVTNVSNPSASSACKPTIADGVGDFYSGDCVPVTVPLGTETWRERVQNTGTLEMSKVVTIDRLPTPGDQGAHALLPRGSEWEPQWNGPVNIIDQAGYRVPAGIEYFYSSAADPCTADLYPATDACPDGVWLPLTADTSPADVRHIKTVFDFAGDHFMPGDVLGYTFQTRTPAVSAVPKSDTVAWNTIAIGAATVTEDGDALGEVLPTEGRRVGVALASGPLEVEKLVTGDGAEFAPKAFKLQVLCTVSATDGSGISVELPPILIEQDIAPGQPVKVAEQLPYGAKCQVGDQPGLNGETSSQMSDPVTINREGEKVARASLTNTYDLGSFSVTKKVVGASNQDGEAIDYGSFPVAATCSFLGEEIAIDPATATLTADGKAWKVSGLPIGAECALTETDAHGATASLTVNGEEQTPETDGSWKFVITADQPEATLELTNTFALGAIEIVKSVTGNAVDAVASDTKFVFDVVCTFDGADVWKGTATLTKAEAVAGDRITIDTLPAGAECAVTESETAGATAVTITPSPADGPVTVGDLDNPVEFTIVNEFTAGGAIHVEKQITGAGAELWGTGTFEVTLACELADVDIEIPGGATRELSADTSLTAEYTGLPLGAACGLTETKTGNATTTQVVDAAGAPVTGPIIVGANDAQLRVVNTFDIGGITVEKQLAGAGIGHAKDKVFTVELACVVGADAESIEVPGGATRELSRAGGLTAEYTQLPVGAECELRETEGGGADAVAITPNLGDPAVGHATVAAGTNAKLTVVNTFGAAPGGGLPNTGSNSGLPWLIGGGSLLLLGAVLIIVMQVRRGRGSASHGSDDQGDAQ